MDKASFDSKISQFFQNYLVGRKTKYLWNSFSSPSFNFDIGVRQGSALSSILSALYLSLVFYIFEKKDKKSKNMISILSSINDGLFIAQEKLLTVSNSHLFCSYHIISSLFDQFGLVIEYGKTEVFHFSRSHRSFNPSLLDLMILSGPILHSKETW